jgi:hypothetical protein
MVSSNHRWPGNYDGQLGVFPVIKRFHGKELLGSACMPPILQDLHRFIGYNVGTEDPTFPLAPNKYPISFDFSLLFSGNPTGIVFLISVCFFLSHILRKFHKHHLPYLRKQLDKNIRFSTISYGLIMKQ